MKKTGRYLRVAAALFLCLLALAACEAGNETDAKKEAFPPMIMLDGKLYKDTGYVNSCLKCGTPDGKILTSVDETRKPAKDYESNFGKGYDFQRLSDTRLNVSIDGKWHIFEDLSVKASGIPEQTARFQAEVMEISDDGLLVAVTEIPEEFAWIFKNQDTARIKPVFLPVESFEKMKGESLPGKTVEVWFDGSIKEDRPESSAPIVPGTVYKIKIVEKEQEKIFPNGMERRAGTAVRSSSDLPDFISVSPDYLAAVAPGLFPSLF